MKRIWIIVVIGSLSIETLFSQDLKLVKNTLNSVFIEQYYVSPLKPDIKQGLYQKYLAHKSILIEQGYYKDNQKDSTWINYDGKGRVVQQCDYSSGIRNGIWQTIIYNGDTSVVTKEGHYTNNKMSGRWAFRNVDGTLSYRYDFDKRAIIQYGKNTDPSTFIDKTDTLSAVLDTPAIHVGGADSLTNLVAKNMKVPFIYPKNGKLDQSPKSYRLILSFIVDENGKLEDLKVIRGVRKEYDDEALRALKLCDDGNWIPARYKGHSVKVLEILPMKLNVSYYNAGTEIIRLPFNPGDF